MTGIYGPISQTAFAYYNRESQSLRMSQDILPLDLPKFSLTLPQWGEMRNGELFARATPAHATKENGFSSSALLPTPVVNDMGANKEIDQWDSWCQRMRERHNNNGHGDSLSVEARRTAPDMGKYAGAVEHWETVSGRPAPAATDEHGQLNPRFVEWMMDLPSGYVTDAGLSRRQTLKILGNGVVPAQAALALRLLA